MDMDGVLYRGDHPLPGAVDTLTTLRARGVRVAFLTNNASRHREELAARMSRLGFACATDDVWGSAYITALYLSRHAPDARVFLVGTAGMRREMEEAGVEVMPTHEGATHVVAGLDMTITYEKLSHAHYAICNGAAFIATNLDATFPDGPTTTTPGGGALVAALTTSTGVTPLVMGKPKPTGLSLIAASWGVSAGDMAVVGDRLDTDIAAANAFGCLSVLVLTGVSTRTEAEKAGAAERPRVVLENLTNLPAVLEGRCHVHSPSKPHESSFRA
jgi:phosphoglycolate/pyridoxal phosphate phosphatase family enzyme